VKYSTCIFSVFQIIPAARLELGALDDISEGEDDVGTELGVDVFR